MSKTEASTFDTVEKVEIDLTEKGLTELARMLVQSGRMSAPSFTNWCSRVAPSASRWARSQRGAQETVKATSGKSGNRKSGNTAATAATNTVPPGNTSVKVNKKTVNDGIKFSGFKKAHPNETMGSWAEVLSASSEDKERWMKEHLLLRGIAPSKETVLKILSDFNLNEEEVKQSRAWFPFLPDSSAQYHALESSYDGESGLKEPSTELLTTAPVVVASYAAAASRDIVPAGSTGTSLTRESSLSAKAQEFVSITHTALAPLPERPNRLLTGKSSFKGKGKNRKSGKP